MWCIENNYLKDENLEGNQTSSMFKITKKDLNSSLSTSLSNTTEINEGTELNSFNNNTKEKNSTSKMSSKVKRAIAQYVIQIMDFIDEDNQGDT